MLSDIRVNIWLPLGFPGALLWQRSCPCPQADGKRKSFLRLAYPSVLWFRTLWNTLSGSAFLDVVWQILPRKDLSSLLSNSQSLPLAPESPLNWRLGSPHPHPGQWETSPDSIQNWKEDFPPRSHCSKAVDGALSVSFVVVCHSWISWAAGVFPGNVALFPQHDPLVPARQPRDGLEQGPFTVRGPVSSASEQCCQFMSR